MEVWHRRAPGGGESEGVDRTVAGGRRVIAMAAADGGDSVQFDGERERMLVVRVFDQELTNESNRILGVSDFILPHCLG